MPPLGIQCGDASPGLDYAPIPTSPLLSQNFPREPATIAATFLHASFDFIIAIINITSLITRVILPSKTAPTWAQLRN